MSDPTHCFVGIDVSKSHWDVAIHGNKSTQRFSTSEEGTQALVFWLGQLDPVCIVVEASGGYQQPLVEALQQVQLPVAVINPRQARDFAKAHNKLAKTDRLDALTLALFAAQMNPKPTPQPSENAEQLKRLHVRRTQVKAILTQEKNRLAQQRDAAMKILIRRAIDFYEQQCAEIEQQIKELTKSDPQLEAKATLLTTAPGVGLITATGLIAEVPELGRLNRGQVARLLGVAPINRDSGQFRGKRTTSGGRRVARKALYMATLVATRHNAIIKQHYAHLQTQGKRKIVALVACMRKFILILNAMLKNNQPWRYTTKNA
jgi:transposase